MTLATFMGLLSAVCWVESHHNPRAINLGDRGEPSVGLCQVKLSTARMMGYRGDREGLLNPATNMRIAGKYLAWQLKRYRGDVRRAVAAYNCGSVPGKIRNTKYVGKVLAAWGSGK